MNNGLTKRDQETIWAIFERYPKVEKVYVFGSRAKESTLWMFFIILKLGTRN